ncbi:phosphotransferase [Longispora sp. K20-0274]|uniref:phosphotransferase enzyme family protein n=1 Tax=Longispora sp. K20-0274 TaxID=3088255 RepID=UPI00399C199A
MDPVEIARGWGVSARSARRPDQGTNNSVWILDDGYVLRVYQNLPLDRVLAEHRLLAALGPAGLSFRVPTPVGPVLETAAGPAALFEYLPGTAGRRGADVEAMGAALGELDLALGTLDPALAPTDWRVPLSEVHPAVPDVDALVGDLRAACGPHPGLDVLDRRAAETDAAYRKMDLPVQICHLDFAPGNLLFADGRVSAVLDFEIAGLDLRVSDLVAGALQCGPGFVRGYRSIVDVSEAELAAVPVLTLLRAMSSVVWRAGRWRQGLSTLDEVVERLAEIVLLAEAPVA